MTADTWTDPRLANWPDGDLDAKCADDACAVPQGVHCMRIGGTGVTVNGQPFNGEHDAHHWHAPLSGGEVHCPGSVRVPMPRPGCPEATMLVRRDRLPA